MTSTHKLLTVTLGIAVSLLSSPARAEPQPRALVFKLRFEPPMTGAHWGQEERVERDGTRSARFGFADTSLFGGLSASFEMWDRFALELRAGAVLFGGYQLGVRPGYSFTFVDSRRGGPRGWQLQLPLQLGYELRHRAEGGGDASWDDHGHFLVLGTALESTYWIYRHFGINARVLVSGLLRIGGTVDAHKEGTRELKSGVGLAFSLGISI